MVSRGTTSGGPKRWVLCFLAVSVKCNRERPFGLRSIPGEGLRAVLGDASTTTGQTRFGHSQRTHGDGPYSRRNSLFRLQFIMFLERERDMTNESEALYRSAVSLPPVERARLVERILSSFSIPEREEIDRLQATEAEDRIGAYERGELKARTAEEVFQNIQKLR